MTRTEELTAKLLDSALAEDEWAELESLLASDPSAMEEHESLLELEGVLRGLRAGFDLSGSTLARVKDAQLETTTQAVMSEIAVGAPPAWAAPARNHRRGWFAALGAAAIAAAVVIGLWLGAKNAQPDRETSATASDVSFARLTRAIGAVELLTPQGDVHPAAEGREIPLGHTVRTVGEGSLAQVQLPDRTLVDIEPDSVVRILASNEVNAKPRLFLAAGQLTAAVSEGEPDHHLVVGTNVADLFARKGMYVVSSAGPESARVDVKQGNVQVVRRNAPAPVQIARGSAVVRAGAEKVLIEPAVRVDRTAARSLPVPAARDAVFAPDGNEVWVASARQFTRWTRDGGTADTIFPPRKGFASGPLAAFSRDKTVLLASSIFTAAKDEKGIPLREERLLLRDLPEGRERRELEIKLPEPRYAAAGPGAAWIAIVEPKVNPKRLRVINGTGGDRFAREFDQVISCVASPADGAVLAIGLSNPARIENNTIVLLDPVTGHRLSALPTQRKGLTALTFSADGRFLAAGFNGLVQVWDVRSRELVKSIVGFERVLSCLAFSQDGRALAGGTQDGLVWIWSAASGRPVQLIEVGSRGVRAIAFSPDGRRLVTVANSPTVLLWDVVDPSIAPPDDAE